MSAPSPKELWKLWQQNKILVMQAIGYLIQLVVKLNAKDDEQAVSLRNLRADVDSLIAHTKMPPNPKARR